MQTGGVTRLTSTSLVGLACALVQNSDWIHSKSFSPSSSFPLIHFHFTFPSSSPFPSSLPLLLLLFFFLFLPPLLFFVFHPVQLQRHQILSFLRKKKILFDILSSPCWTVLSAGSRGLLVRSFAIFISSVYRRLCNEQVRRWVSMLLFDDNAEVWYFVRSIGWPIA